MRRGGKRRGGERRRGERRGGEGRGEGGKRGGKRGGERELHNGGGALPTKMKPHRYVPTTPTMTPPSPPPPPLTHGPQTKPGGDNRADGGTTGAIIAYSYFLNHSIKNNIASRQVPLPHHAHL